MLIKQISVFVENKVGALAEVCDLLVENDIDIRALSIADTTDFGILRLIVNNPDAAFATLKEGGHTVSLTNVIAVSFSDHPGGLAGILKLLNDKQIHIEYMYAFVTKSHDTAYGILRIEDSEGAVRILEECGVRIMCADELYKL